jgi:sigma54-dependent transcription regulator
MELLGAMGRLKSSFGPFGDGVSFLARYVHGLRQTYHGLKKCFGRTQWSS